MTARCSLDEFIEHNKDEVRVGPSSAPVEFRELDYRVPPGALFDLRGLKGEGYQLESTDVREGTDISKGMRHAFILDQEGSPTGYQLVSRGDSSLGGSQRFSAYFIESNRPKFNLKRMMEEMERDRRRYGT